MHSWVAATEPRELKIFVIWTLEKNTFDDPWLTVKITQLKIKCGPEILKWRINTWREVTALTFSVYCDSCHWEPKSPIYTVFRRDIASCGAGAFQAKVDAAHQCGSGLLVPELPLREFQSPHRLLKDPHWGERPVCSQACCSLPATLGSEWHMWMIWVLSVWLSNRI